MGAWGTGVLSDDTAHDVYDSYLDLFNRGNTAEAIRANVLKEYSEILDDEDEGPLAWLGIAKAQWDCGQLEPEVMKQVEKHVREGLGLSRWAEQGERVLNRRKAALTQFLAKLTTVNPRPREPRKAIKRSPLFHPGDCLAVRLDDGAWGAILVLQHKPESDDPYKETYGLNLVASLCYRGAETPTLDVFAKRDWLYLNHHSWHNEMVLRFVYALRFRTMKDRLLRIGNIPLRKADPQHDQCRTYSQWSHVAQDIYLQDRWDRGIRD